MSNDVKHIYVVRHGQSRSNATGVYEKGESPLTDEGVAQARVVAQRFTDIPIDIVLSSTMLRAQHTAEIIATHRGVPFETIEHAHEQMRPDEAYYRHKSDPEVATLEQSLWHALQLGTDLPGAETFAQLRKRAQLVKETLENHEAKNIVLASHGNFIKLFVFEVLLGDLFTAQIYGHSNRHMRTKNTGITYFTINDERGWQLQAWNDHAHLG